MSLNSLHCSGWSAIEGMQKIKVTKRTFDPRSLNMISTSKILPNCWKENRRQIRYAVVLQFKSLQFTDSYLYKCLFNGLF